MQAQQSPPRLGAPLLWVSFLHRKLPTQTAHILPSPAALIPMIHEQNKITEVKVVIEQQLFKNKIREGESKQSLIGGFDFVSYLIPPS